MCGEPHGKPMRIPVAIGDLASGLFAAVGIITALFTREHTHVGCKVETSLVDAVMSLLSLEYQSYFITGGLPSPAGMRHPTGPMVGIFQTKDGYLALGPSWPRIARIVNKDWMTEDPRFSTVVRRFEHKKDLEDLIEDGLSQGETKDWLDLMHVEDIAAAPINTLDRAVCDPQIVHNKTIITMHHQAYGKAKGIACPIRMPGVATRGHTPAPTLGENTIEVLKGLLGYSDERVARLKAEEDKRSASRVRRRL
jgi:crotonobetainyl-CoA:carnitine CoA-transferase CaiB-like acyl-CoA transferase